MAVVKELRGTDAASALAYPVTDKKNQVGDRVLFVAGVHCDPETAAADFLAVRMAHGTQGKTRKVRATYALPEPGEAATHVRAEWPTGKGYWRAARDGEDATHVRREGVVYDYVGRGAEGATHVQRGRTFVPADPDKATHVAVVGGYEKQAEIRHFITAYGRDEVNPDDAEAVARVFEYEVRQHEELRPGVQALIVMQADGESGNLHAHRIENATVVADTVVDGVQYRAGQKQGGALSDIFEVRRRYDEHRAAVSAEYGLGPNPQQPSTRTPSVSRTAHDRRAEQSGKLSEADQIRAKVEFIMDELKPTTAEQLVQMCDQQGLETNLRTAKTGRNKGRTTLTFKLPEMDRFAGPKRLGARYDWNDTVDKEGVVVVEGIGSQLEHIAAGRPRKPLPVPVKQGVPKPVRVPSEAELDEAAEHVAALAAHERQQRALDDEWALVTYWVDWAARQQELTAEQWLATQGLSLDDADDVTTLRERYRDYDASIPKRDAHADDAALRTAVAAKPVEESVETEPEHVTEPVQPDPLAVEDRPVRPAETFTEAGARGAPVDEVMALGRAWDRWRAYVDSGQQAVDEEADRLAAEAASSAHAPDEPVAVKDSPDSAHAPVGETGQARAQMWERTDPNARVQKIIEECRPWGEEARARLLAGQRLVEADVPMGIGPKFLRDHGEGFWPEVREQLALRAAKKALAQSAFEAGRAANADLTDFRTEAEKQDPLNWFLDQRAKELNLERRKQDKVHQKLVEEIAAGVYEATGRRSLEDVLREPMTVQAEVDRELGD